VTLETLIDEGAMVLAALIVVVVMSIVLLTLLNMLVSLLRGLGDEDYRPLAEEEDL
jgi:hypothetical protein